MDTTKTRKPATRRSNSRSPEPPGSSGESGKGGRATAAEAAARLLSARALSESELRARLARRGYPPAQIAESLASLARLGYLDDRALAYNVATSLASRKPYGRSRVGAELRRRGLGPDAVNEALTRVFSEVDEAEMALRAALAMTRSHPLRVRDGESAQAARARSHGKLARALARRGFSGAAMRRALACAGRQGPRDGTIETDATLETDDRNWTNDDDDFQADS